MPPLADRTQPLDTKAYTREPASSGPMPPANPQWTPPYNANMRCPVPPSSFTPDASQQFYRGNTLPQFRAFSPQNLAGTANNGSSVTNTSVTESNATTTTVTLQPKMASVTTTVLSPGQNFTGTLTMSRMFALQQVTATGAARIRVYATAAAQTADLSRTSAQAPAYGITQGLIAGVSLTTAPYIWLFTPPAIGTNGSNPTSPLAYVTVTQLGTGSGAVTVGFTYLPLQS
jgi:hypothetical protein